MRIETWTLSRAITGIPEALKVWCLTFHSSCHGSQRTCSHQGQTPFILSGQLQKHAIVVPMMTRVTTNQPGYSHYSHLGQSHGFSLCLEHLYAVQRHLSVNIITDHRKFLIS